MGAALSEDIGFEALSLRGRQLLEKFIQLGVLPNDLLAFRLLRVRADGVIHVVLGTGD
jgi:hypothetical protein